MDEEYEELSIVSHTPIESGSTRLNMDCIGKDRSRYVNESKSSKSFVEGLKGFSAVFFEKRKVGKVKELVKEMKIFGFLDLEVNDSMCFHVSMRNMEVVKKEVCEVYRVMKFMKYLSRDLEELQILFDVYEEIRFHFRGLLFKVQLVGGKYLNHSRLMKLFRIEDRFLYYVCKVNSENSGTRPGIMKLDLEKIIMIFKNNMYDKGTSQKTHLKVDLREIINRDFLDFQHFVITEKEIVAIWKTGRIGKMSKEDLHEFDKMGLNRLNYYFFVLAAVQDKAIGFGILKQEKGGKNGSNESIGIREISISKLEAKPVISLSVKKRMSQYDMNTLYCITRRYYTIFLIHSPTLLYAIYGRKSRYCMVFERQLDELMGGSVVFDSECSVGSKSSIYLHLVVEDAKYTKMKILL